MERKREKKEEGRKKEEENPGLELLFGILVWNFGLELLYLLEWNLCMDLLIRKLS